MKKPNQTNLSKKYDNVSVKNNWLSYKLIVSYIYIYIYIYMYVCMYVCIQREREKEKEREKCICIYQVNEN